MLRAPTRHAIAIALVLAPAAAAGDTLAVTSRIEQATVYPSGAEILREITAGLPAGETVLELTGLPVSLDPRSLRAAGAAEAPVTIGFVEAETVRADPEDDVDVLQDQIQTLEDERASLEDGIRVAEARRDFFMRLSSEFPATLEPVEGQPPADPTTWADAWQNIGSGLSTAFLEIAEARLSIREIDERLNELREDLQNLVQGPPRSTTVRMTVTTETATSADLSLSYYVPGASWQPTYDAMLATDDEGAPRLTITRRASVSQSTGEDWEDVALVLATSRPGGGTAAPDLPSQSIEFRPPFRPMAEGAVVGKAADQYAAEPQEKRMVTRDLARAQVQVAAAPPVVAADIGRFDARFVIPGAVNIESRGPARAVPIGEAVFEATLSARTVPARDRTAYVYAGFSLSPDAPPLLPGRVSLRRDGVFVGTGRMDHVRPGAKHKLPFGPDANIEVTYAEVERQAAEEGMLVRENAETRNYRIAVTIRNAAPVDVTVIDRRPVPRHDDISVEPLPGTTEPSETDIDGKPGVLAWSTALEPGSSRTINHGFKVTWPKDKGIWWR